MPASILTRLSLGIALAAALGAGCRSLSPPPEGPPSILVVSIDTLRADRTSLHGHERETTPFLESLARDGTRFEIAYAPTSTTAPTHATLFTGVLPVRHGLNQNGKVLDESHPVVTEVFRDAGYDTGAVVSSFVLDEKFGFARGFESYSDDFDASMAKFRARRWEGHRVRQGFDQPGDQTTNRAIEWLEGREDPDRPFLLFVHYFDPHEPYQPPPVMVERFGAGEEGISNLERQGRLYDGAIAFTDQQIGRLVRRMDELADPRGTIVVVTADHGQGLMDHGDPFHSVFIYEEDVRVPLVFRGIGRISEGRVIRGPAGVVDIAPTLLDLAGLEAGLAEPLDGLSLAETLTGGAWEHDDRPMYLQRQHYTGRKKVRGHRVKGEVFGVREGRWKYVEGRDENRRELFDLESDPDEATNALADEPAQASSLAGKLRHWRFGEEPAVTRTPEDLSEELSESLSEEDRERLRALGYIE